MIPDPRYPAPAPYPVKTYLDGSAVVEYYRTKEAHPGMTEISGVPTYSTFEINRYTGELTYTGFIQDNEENQRPDPVRQYMDPVTREHCVMTETLDYALASKVANVHPTPALTQGVYVWRVVA